MVDMSKLPKSHVPFFMVYPGADTWEKVKYDEHPTIHRENIPYKPGAPMMLVEPLLEEDQRALGIGGDIWDNVRTLGGPTRVSWVCSYEEKLVIVFGRFLIPMEDPNAT